MIRVDQGVDNECRPRLSLALPTMAGVNNEWSAGHAIAQLSAIATAVMRNDCIGHLMLSRHEFGSNEFSQANRSRDPDANNTLLLIYRE